MKKQKKCLPKPLCTILALALLLLPGAGRAGSTIQDVRDTVRVIPIKLDTEAQVPIQKGEVLKLLKLYHDNANAWSWNEYLAFEPCPREAALLCAVPFRDTQGKEYSLRDAPHDGEDALTTVGFYTVQSAQGRWNLFMIRMERPLGDSTYAKTETTAHVSLFRLAPHDTDGATPENNYFEEIATLPMGGYCNSTAALASFLKQPLPPGTAPDGCMQGQ